MVRGGTATRLPRWLECVGAVAWRLLAAGAVGYFALQLLLYLHLLVLPILFGLFLAALLEPVVGLAEKVLPRGLAALSALLLALAVLGAVFAFVGVRVAAELGEASGFIERGLGRLAALLGKAPVGTNPEELGAGLTRWLESHGGGVASGIASGARTAFLTGSQLLLTLAFTFFMLRDGPNLFDALIRRVDERRKAQVRRMAESAWGTLGRYERGLSLIALLNSLQTGLVLVVLDIPIPLPIMVLTFVGSFVPFVGPIIAGAVASLVALADSGVTNALLMVGAALLIQVIEGNVLEPFILGRRMRLQPLAILAAVTSGAIVAGIAGAFLAIPILAAARSALSVRSDAPEGRGDASRVEPSE